MQLEIAREEAADATLVLLSAEGVEILMPCPCHRPERFGRRSTRVERFGFCERRVRIFGPGDEQQRSLDAPDAGDRLKLGLGHYDLRSNDVDLGGCEPPYDGAERPEPRSKTIAHRLADRRID